MKRTLDEATTGIGEITLFDVDEMPTTRAAEIRDFELDQLLDTRQTYLDRASQFALAATQLALEDAGLSREAVPDAALFYGSAFGCMDTMALFFDDLATKGPRLVKPFLFPHTYSNTPISLLAIEFGIRGYHANYASGCVASGCAIIDAYDRVRSGRCELALAGGVDAISLPAYEGLTELGELSPGDGGAEHCAPFSSARNGMVLGEGAATLVIESHDHAGERGATILGEITGASLAGGNDPSGYADAARRSLSEAATRTPDAICAGANGSVAQDHWLGAGIRGFFDDRSAAVPITSIAPLIGDTAGCMSAHQCAASLLMMESGVLTATLNADDPDPETGVAPVVESTTVQPLQNMLVTTADPGGTVATISLGAAMD
jgi:3-oxoacyl-[acyl-carrier-protein] synthase II